MANININGEKVVGFYDHTTIYPVKVSNGASSLGIVNPSATPIVFTIVTQKGETLSSVVPPISSYSGRFDIIDTLNIIGSLEFYCEVRV